MDSVSRAVVFDFDGVLVDTADEIIVTAYAAVSGQYSCQLQDVPEEARLFFHRWHEQALNAADMVSLLSIWQEGGGGEVTRARLRQYAHGKEAKLVEQLFAARRELIRMNEKAWADLVKPFQPLWNAVCQFRWGCPVIVTNKDRASVFSICRHHGLELSAAVVLSGDPDSSGVVLSKRQRLQSLLDRFSSIMFLEDSLPHLKDVMDLPGVSTALVSWGPVSDEDVQGAESAAVPMVHLSQVIGFLDGWFYRSSDEDIE